MELPKLPADLNAPYQKMYIKLFKAVTGALELMNAGEFLLARGFLVSAQQETEELYIEADRKKEAPPIDRRKRRGRPRRRLKEGGRGAIHCPGRPGVGRKAK